MRQHVQLEPGAMQGADAQGLYRVRTSFEREGWQWQHFLLSQSGAEVSRNGDRSVHWSRQNALHPAASEAGQTSAR